MGTLVGIVIVVFAASMLGILSVFVLYPTGVWILSHLTALETRSGSAELPSVSMLVAVRNGQAYIRDKIENTLNLDYPEDRFEVVFYSDGSTDQTERIVREQHDPRIKLFSSVEHNGKAAALNAGIHHCSGDIVVFSDADALVHRDALRKLVRHYSDPRVGGVCGQRVIHEGKAELERAQSEYIKFDSTIKILESRTGRITSNDGKIYSIRRSLYQPIQEAVTDDLYVCLSVIKQGHRFLFDPDARAFVRLPSRTPRHELTRRRRIVCRSLQGLLSMKSLFNPFHYGLFSLGLFVNKVIRRLLPVFFLLVFLSTLFLSFHYRVMECLLGLQVIFYLAALSYPLLQRVSIAKGFSHFASVPFYFCVGSCGTMLGLADFLRRKRVNKWDPRKTD